MGKVKIQELAKKIGVNSKEIIEQAEALGIEAKSHLDIIDSKDANKIEIKIKEAKKEEASKKTGPVIIRREVIMADQDVLKKQETVKKVETRSKDVGFVERDRKKDYNIVYRNKQAKPLTLDELFGKKEEPKKAPVEAEAPIVEKKDASESEVKPAPESEQKREFVPNNNRPQYNNNREGGRPFNRDNRGEGRPFNNNREGRQTTI